jgi:SAM-dependent methyltransferase
MESDTLRVYNQAAATYDAEPNAVLFTETPVVLGLLHLRKGEALLDAACGTGKYVREGIKAGAHCVGLDFSAEMLALAAAKCPGARFVRHDLMSPPLPFADGAFEKIILAHALWHLGGIESLFAEFSRLLRPGGRLVVTVTHPEAAFRHFKYRVEDFPGGEDLDLSKEKYRYSFEEIKAAGLAAGLTLTAAETVRVDERLRPVLTEESYEQVRETPLILAVRLNKS